MEVLHARCAGLDVHKRVIVACRLTPGQRGHPVREVVSFRTTTRGLLELSDWLAEAAVTVIAMESTGSFWKPVYNVLEASFALVVVNATHLKAVPGRKTDVRDAEWIADLLRHGLLRPSFIPERPERELRELTRYRTTLFQSRTAEVNRIQKVLEGANIKLASVASDVVGVSGRAMLEALIAGDEDAQAIAGLARGRMREKHDALVEALEGRMGPHQRFVLRSLLHHLDTIDELLAEVSGEIAARLAPFDSQLTRLQTIPGVGRRTAETILSEVGTDMGRFPTSRHLASWAGLCPGNHESAGKSTSGRARKGSPRGQGSRPQRDLPRGPAPASRRPAGRSPGHVRRRPQHPRHRLPAPAPGHRLHRSRPRLLRRARSRADGAPAEPAAGGPRVPGAGDRRGLTLAGSH